MFIWPERVEHSYGVAAVSKCLLTQRIHDIVE